MALQIDTLLKLSGKVAPSLNQGVNQLSGRFNHLSKKIDTSRNSTKGFNTSLGNLFTSIRNNKGLLASIGIGAVGAGFAAANRFIDGTLQRFDKTSEKARNAGISYQDLQRIVGAGLEFGIGENELDKVAKAIPELQKRFGELESTGTGVLTKIADSYDLSSLRNSENDIDFLVNGLDILNEAMKVSEEEASFVANSLFGSNGQFLISLIETTGGVDAFSMAMNNASVNSQSAIDKLGDGSKEIGLVGHEWKIFKDEVVALGLSLLPVIKWAGKTIKTFTGWIQENPRLAKTIAIIAGTITGVLTVALIGLSVVIFASVVPALWAMTVPLLPFIAIIALVVAAIVGISTAIFFVVKHWDDLTKFFIGAFNKVKDFFLGIPDFFKGIFVKALEFVLDFVNQAIGLINGLLDNDIVKGIAGSIGITVGKIPELELSDSLQQVANNNNDREVNRFADTLDTAQTTTNNNNNNREYNNTTNNNNNNREYNNTTNNNNNREYNNTTNNNTAEGNTTIDNHKEVNIGQLEVSIDAANALTVDELSDDIGSRLAIELGSIMDN